MHGHLPVAGSSAALPGNGEGKALLITTYLTVKAAAHPVITVSLAAGGPGGNQTGGQASSY